MEAQTWNKRIFKRNGYVGTEMTELCKNWPEKSFKLEQILNLLSSNLLLQPFQYYFHNAGIHCNDWISLFPFTALQPDVYSFSCFVNQTKLSNLCCKPSLIKKSLLLHFTLSKSPRHLLLPMQKLKILNKLKLLSLHFLTTLYPLMILDNGCVFTCTAFPFYFFLLIV